MEVYSGYVKSKTKLLNSSSGGVATSLAERIIEIGGVVFGVRYTDDFYSAEFCKVDSICDLKQIQGTKYINASKKYLFENLPEALSSNRYVLIFGLGCDIAAVRAFCKNKDLNTDRLFCVDILCHGPAPQIIHENFIKELEKKYKGKIVEYSVRYKYKGWYPFYVRAVFDNGKVYLKPFSNTDFGIAFYNVANPLCTKCCFKGEKHQGDICVGDYWGIQPNSSTWNYYGVSVIVIQNEKGKRLLGFLDNSFFIEPASKDIFLMGNPMYYESRKELFDNDVFIKCLEKNGLHFAVKKLLVDKHHICKILKKIKRIFF